MAEFNEEVAAVRQEAEAQFPPKVQTNSLSSDESRLLEVAKVSPRAAIVEAWRLVEIAAGKAVDERLPTLVLPDINFRPARPRSPIALARELTSLEVLNAKQLSVFHELRNLRNQASHAEDFEMDFESANNYIQSAEALRLAIQQRGDDASQVTPSK